jgi:FkbM family methyltransferase
MDTLNIAVGPVSVDLLDDDRICQHIKAGKTFEPDTLAAWAKMCRPGSSVIDVGAYSGLFAISAAKLGAHVTAIEPQPQMCDRLASNRRLNEVSFTILQAAASDARGVARLGVNAAVHLTSGASLLRKSGHGITVHTIRLDDLEIRNVSAIKIDVERLETAVLRGALGLIARDRPSLIVEFLDDAARRAILDLLPDYDVAAVTDVRNLILQPRAL